MTRAPLIAFAVLAGLATARAAGFDCSKWTKNDDGTWSAKEPIEIGGPAGRLDYMPGEIYKEGQSRNGLDIVKLLNANCAANSGAPDDRRRRARRDRFPTTFGRAPLLRQVRVHT